jgi:uncharacterized protein (TIGR02145 family)
MHKIFYAQNIMTSSPPTALGYGYLYNWYVVNSGIVAPSGWHVPSATELNTLITTLGGTSIAGGDLKETGTFRWNSPNTGATNSSGFTGRPTGHRSYLSTGQFRDLKNLNRIWSATPFITEFGDYAYSYVLSYLTTAFTVDNGQWQQDGNSIRLIKNNSTNPGTVIDYDGNSYDCITIGTQVWIVQNWKCTHYNEGTLIPTVTDNSAWVALTTGAKCAYNNDESNV